MLKNRNMTPSALPIFGAYPRPILLSWLLLNGLDEIAIELFGDRIEPLPVVDEWLENDGVSVTTDPNLLALESEVFRKPNRLRSARPKYFCGFH
jgi:hypothetical protein